MVIIKPLTIYGFFLNRSTEINQRVIGISIRMIFLSDGMGFFRVLDKLIINSYNLNINSNKLYEQTCFLIEINKRGGNNGAVLLQ